MPTKKAGVIRDQRVSNTQIMKEEEEEKKKLDVRPNSFKKYVDLAAI